MSKWLTVKDACHVLGMSERTLRRHIQEDKIKTKLENKRRYVLIDADIIDHDPDMTVDMSDHDKTGNSELLQQLRSENEFLRSQVKELQEDISQSRERSDTLILNLTRHLDNSQRMLESSQMKAKRSWWHRLFRKASDEAN